MPKQQVPLKFETEVVQALDARAQREGVSRQALIDFAIEPLMKDGEVRVLILPLRVIEMLDLIAKGQGVNRVDVMRRALIDYAGRAAERWQINARAGDQPRLRLIEAEIRDEHGINPYEGH